MDRSAYCVVIPAYNSAGSLPSLLRAVRSQGLDVVVVDDGSTDETGNIAQEHGAVLLRQAANHGKGAALRAGFRYAVQKEYSGVITMDSDGQHNPEDLPRLLEAAEKGTAKLVVGNRMKDSHAMPIVRRWTNRAMSRIISRLIRQEVPDTQCGFRFIHRDVLERVPLMATHFDIESEILLAAARHGWRVVSEPISTIYGDHGSYIRPMRDAWRFLRLVARHLVSR